MSVQDKKYLLEDVWKGMVCNVSDSAIPPSPP